MKIIFKATLLFLMVFILMVFMISCSKNYDDASFIGTGDSTLKGKALTSATTPEPIGGAIMALNGTDAATTATDGTYVITGVGKGTYTITATLGSSVGSTVFLVDTLGETYEDVDVTIQQSTSSSGKIIGRVIDATTGNGINNVIVKVEEMDVTTLSMSGATASSDSDIVAAYGAAPTGEGYFILQNIDIGNFKVSFTKQGYFSNMKRLSVAGAAALDAGTTFLSYDLSSAGMIVGHVTDTLGIAVANAEVTLDTGQVTTTNANGDYKVENLPERIYDPNVPEPGYSVTITNNILTQTSNKISVFAGKTTIVDVTLGVTMPPPNLVLPPDSTADAFAGGSSIATDQPTFNWTGVGNADYYKLLVYLDADADGDVSPGDSIVWQHETSSSITTSIMYNSDGKAQPLVPASNYVWEVMAANFSSVSIASSTYNFTKLDPSAGVAGVGGTTINQPITNSIVAVNTPVIAWTPITDATGYRVRVYRDSTAFGVLGVYEAAFDELVWDYNAGTATSAIYNSNSLGQQLVDGGQYLVFVDTQAGSSVSSSAMITFKKAAMEPPVLIAPQTAIVVDPSIATSIDFVWHSVPGATRYVLKIFKNIGVLPDLEEGDLVWETGTATNYVTVSLATLPAGNYAWKVGVSDLSSAIPVDDYSVLAGFKLTERVSWSYVFAGGSNLIEEVSGITTSLTVSLNANNPPTSNVFVRVTTDTQSTVSPGADTITFAGPYISGAFIFTAVADGVVEAPHTSTVTITLRSQDTRYDNKTMTATLTVID